MKKKSLLARLLFVCVISVVSLFLLGAGAFYMIYLMETAPVTPENKAFAQSMIDVGSVETPFTAVNRAPWDTVCYFGIYESLDKAIFIHNGFAPGTEVPDGDFFTMEAEYAMAFIDTAQGKTKFVVTRVREPFSQIDGPRCMERKNAHFVVRQKTVREEISHELIFIEKPAAAP